MLSLHRTDSILTVDTIQLYDSVSQILEAKIPKSDVPDVYRRIARLYDLWALLTESKARIRCLDLADVHDGETVLEVAVGTGLLFADIVEKNPSGRNVGIDLTKAMLERARARIVKSGATNVSLSIGDAYALDCADQAFDLVVNTYMFDLLPEQDFADILAEFRRVLKPGGRVVLANMTKPDRWCQAFWEWLYTINPRLMGGCRGVLLQPYLCSAGFVEVRHETLSQLGFPSELLIGIRPM